MEQDPAQPVKIFFRFYSELLDQEVTETLWAESVNEGLGYYRLSSIPFYVPQLALDDVVYALYDDGEEMLKYIETVKSSGNSTIWVVVVDDHMTIETVQEIFSAMDCISEAFSERFFAMEVRSTINYLKVKNRLIELRSSGIIDFTESCLSANHQY